MTPSKRHTSLFGIGLTIESEYQFSESLILRPFTLNSDIEWLKTRTRSQRDYGFICALAKVITFELEISAAAAKDVAIAGWNAQWILILISIYLRSPVYWPLNGYRSDAMGEPRKVLVGNIFFSHRIFSPPVPVPISTLDKCAASIASFNNLLSDERFSFAASVTAHNYNEPKASVRVAAIWAAIESLLGFESELRFRIAAAAARLLEPQSDARYLRFKNVQKLYDLRSKCVHGGNLKNKDQETAVLRSLGLLCELLIFFMKRGSLLDKAERDRIFFSDSSPLN